MRNSNTNLTPYWERRIKDLNSTGNFNSKKLLFYLKVTLYSFSLLMILWSFFQSFAATYTNYHPDPGVGLEFGFLPSDNGTGTGDVKFDLGSWSIAGPRYHAFYRPTWIYGPFLSWFVYPVAYVFMNLMWFFHKFPELKENGLYVIFSMLIIMFFMRFVTFWTTLRSSIYQEKQLLHQSAIDAISSKYDKYDITDKQARLRKHQELSAYYKKHNLKPLAILENFFINTPVFLIVFKVITICRPIKFTVLLNIWDLSKTPLTTIFDDFFNEGWMYLVLCLIIIPTNFFSQKTSIWLSQARNPSLKKNIVDKNSQTYKMQRIQKAMTFIFLLFTFFWSTGLAIYYFFNSVFTIFQNLIIHQILLFKKSNESETLLKLKKLGI
ncbi:Membrane protein OxaA [Mycoplasma haemocanis str. Illinois]|uniref:Membrane protein OxaA n=1 Tax=Mycoplasma haemocanis (strain Illinois) TaxID=1111676 RepID=H6N8P8_MYCHN|nr:YidC/Oxa1 family membrane protein insertase [Mycoplasma haemocanis]AEW46020.1 Membrane protein OxaA [Mycoplasma haemocanis str. Illinois]